MVRFNSLTLIAPLAMTPSSTFAEVGNLRVSDPTSVVHWSVASKSFAFAHLISPLTNAQYLLQQANRELGWDWRTKCATTSTCELIPTAYSERGQMLEQGVVTKYDFEHYSDYTISCTAGGGGGKINKVTFKYGDGESKLEWGSPYALNGNSGPRFWASEYLGSCGMKKVEAIFEVWNGECFRQTFELNACDQDDKPAGGGEETGPILASCPYGALPTDANNCECMEGFQRDGGDCVPICQEYINDWVGSGKGCPHESRCADIGNDNFQCADLADGMCAGGCGANEKCVDAGAEGFKCVCDMGMGRLNPDGACVSVCLPDIYGPCGKYATCFQSMQGAFCTATLHQYEPMYNCDDRCADDEKCVRPIETYGDSHFICAKKY